MAEMTTDDGASRAFYLLVLILGLVVLFTSAAAVGNLQSWGGYGGTVEVPPPPEPDNSSGGPSLDQPAEDESSRTYSIYLAPEDPPPGSNVTVSVLQNNQPTPGLIVSFNGERIGHTDEEGEVSARVPYTETLNVSVRRRGSASAPPATGGMSLRSRHPTAKEDGTFTPVEHSPVFQQDGEDQPDSDNRTATFSISTDVSTTSPPIVRPGQVVSASFDVADEPVSNADIYVGEQRVGRTDGSGSLTYTVPESAAPGDRVQVHVPRDNFTTTVGTTVGNVSIQFDGGTFILPTRPVTISVTLTDGSNHIPLANHPVTVLDGDGNAVADRRTLRTEDDGTVTVEAPMTDTIRAETTYNGETVRESVSGIFQNIAALFIVLGGGGVAIFLLAYRVYSPSGRVRNTLWALVIATAALLHSAGIKVKRSAQQLLRKPTAAGRFLGNALLRLLLAPVRALQALVAAVRGGEPGPDEIAPPEISGDPEDEQPSGTAPDRLDDSPYARIVRRWQWLVNRVTRSSSSGTTATTVEISEKAIDYGLPSGPVTRLRQAFQRVEYGDRDPGDHVQDVESAAEDIEATDGDAADHPDGDAA